MDNQTNNQEDKYELIEWDKAKYLAQKINPMVFQRVSNFFDSKNHDNFVPKMMQDDSLRIFSKFPKADETTNYYFELTSTGLEFFFSNQNTGLYVEVLNEFDDFETYFEVNHDYGSAISGLLYRKYNKVFEERIKSGEDVELFEDCKIYFIDNFVNYILNDVYYEE